MDNSSLLKIFLIISLSGILFLLFTSNLEPKLSTISELKNGTLDSRVKIAGNITSQKEISEDFFIIKIDDGTGKIDILLDKNFTFNKTVEVTGILTEYEDKLQIQAEKITEK